MSPQLFQPNNHSTWKISYRPVSPEEFSRLSDVFLRLYPDLAERILTIEQVSEIEINSNNFKLRVTKAGSEADYLLRRYPETRNIDAVREAHEAMEFLRANGLNVPEIVLAASGEVLVADDGVQYSVFRFIEADHYRGTLEELQSAAREFGKLDTLLTRLPNLDRLRELTEFPERVLELRMFSLEVWEKIFFAAAVQAEEHPEDDFHTKFLSFKEFILDAVHRTTPGSHEVPVQMIHFDLHPHNLLTDGVSLVAILDFDSLRYLERMRGVAFAMHRLVRQHVVFTRSDDFPGTVSRARELFLSAYQEHCPLTPEEVNSAAYFLRSEALSRLSYAMKDLYFNGNPAWKGDLEKQTATIAESALFEMSL
ncbi:phosphotransferase [Candidatus Uhrbacteria bacterium]|nr:phosphotransferase [Candidatus Uhrbacteria bacterium]